MMTNTTNDAAGTTDEYLAEAVHRLIEALHPEQIYLFGSRARGDATQRSDFDLLVVVNQTAQQPYQLQRQAYRALLGLAIPIDIVVLTRDRFERRRTVTGSLPATVDREGRLLYAA